MKAHTWIAASIGLILSQALITGCGPKSNAGNENSKPVIVEVRQVEALSEQREIRYSGTIRESVTIPLSFSTVGTVKAVYVDEGQAVRKAQTLAVLNDETYKNALSMAEATLKRAQDAVARLKPMYENGSLPEIKMVEVETSLQQAQASYEISKKNVDDCVLKATESGIVGKRSIEPGMSILPGVNSITIVQVQRVYAKISVHESEIAAITKGSPATVVVPALDNAAYTGSVDDIGILADPLSHTYTVTISIANKNGQLRPGMICNVSMKQSGRQEVHIVPAEAVLIDNDGNAYVYIADRSSGAAVKTPVERGAFVDEGICIRGGVPPDALVITGGQNKLYDGARVIVKNEGAHVADGDRR